MICPPYLCQVEVRGLAIYGYVVDPVQIVKDVLGVSIVLNLILMIVSGALAIKLVINTRASP